MPKKQNSLLRAVLRLETARSAFMFPTKEQQKIINMASNAAEAILIQGMTVAANKNVLTKPTTKKKNNVLYNLSVPAKMKKGRFNVKTR
jgi:hypothetical protein